MMTREQVQKEKISAEFLRCGKEKNILGQYLQAADFFWLLFFIKGKKVTTYILVKPPTKISILNKEITKKNSINRKPSFKSQNG